jgi:hypothetical protein
VFCFRDSAGEERGSEQCFVSGTVQKREVVSSVLFQ